jgi:hexosaminidase
MKCQVNDMNGYDGGFYYQNAFCAGTEKSFEFLQDVLDETMDLFPDEYIHIGADEVHKFFWSRCPNCQKRMQDQGLNSTHELQSYFVKRIEAYLNAKGRRLIGWDEILEGGLAPNATVMSWRGMAGGIAAAKAGHDVIMAPGEPLYFDSGQGPDERPIQKVYAFEPVPRDLTALEARHILGAQGQAWTEWMETTDDVEYKVYPRACALAEVLWSDPAQRNWADFQGRMSSHYDRLARKGVNYCRPFLTGLPDRTLFLDKQTVTIKKPIEDMIVRYTLDGTAPTENSPLYKGPFSIQSDCHVRAIGWFSDGVKTDELEGYFEKTVFHEPITADDLQPGLQCGYYPGRFETVESIESGQMQRTETVENFVFPKNIQMDNFGVIYDGFIKVEQDGIYTFYTASDDGSQLWVQDRRVVQNDGPHGQREKAGQIALKAGFHPIRVLFFEAAGSEVLSVSYEGPGIKKQPIPPGALFTKSSEEMVTDYLRNETPEAFNRRMAWWRDARFGMFINWAKTTGPSPCKTL